MIELEGKRKVWPTLDEVLAKDTWQEDDITVLIAHQDMLDDATLIKIGILAPSIEEVVDAPVAPKKKK